jgi:hypothetical protein
MFAGRAAGGAGHHVVVERGDALTLPRTRRDDDAKSAFASCGHAAALALGCYVPILLQKSVASFFGR